MTSKFKSFDMSMTVKHMNWKELNTPFFPPRCMSEVRCVSKTTSCYVEKHHHHLKRGDACSGHMCSCMADLSEIHPLQSDLLGVQTWDVEILWIQGWEFLSNLWPRRAAFLVCHFPLYYIILYQTAKSMICNIVCFCSSGLLINFEIWQIKNWLCAVMVTVFHLALFNK